MVPLLSLSTTYVTSLTDLFSSCLPIVTILYCTLHSSAQADETDTTQEVLGKTIAAVFGVKFGFHNFIQSQLARITMKEVVEVRYSLQFASRVAILTASSLLVPLRPARNRTTVSIDAPPLLVTYQPYTMSRRAPGPPTRPTECERNAHGRLDADPAKLQSTCAQLSSLAVRVSLPAR